MPDPSSVRDHDVPVRVRELGTSITSEWDLTLQQILPYVDGVRFVKRISLDAGVEVALVKHCVRQLLYYGCVSLVDIFQYSNIYTTGRRVNLLASNQEFGRQCVAYVTKRSMAKPLISKVFSLFPQKIIKPTYSPGNKQINYPGACWSCLVEACH